jgi:hypothetical protein
MGGLAVSAVEWWMGFGYILGYILEKESLEVRWGADIPFPIQFTQILI